MFECRHIVLRGFNTHFFDTGHVWNTVAHFDFQQTCTGVLVQCCGDSDSLLYAVCFHLVKRTIIVT